jgi:hypothetical protein
MPRFYFPEGLDALAQAVVECALRDAAKKTNHGWILLGAADFQSEAAAWLRSARGHMWWVGLGWDEATYRRALLMIKKALG